MTRVFSKLLIALLVLQLLGIPMPSHVQAEGDVSVIATDEEGREVEAPLDSKGEMIFGIVVAVGLAVYRFFRDVFKDKDKFRSLEDAYLFHEGNNCKQQLVGSAPAADEEKIAWNMKKKNFFDNDEARSVLIQRAHAGEVLRVYDDPGGSVTDDWTEITIKRDISPDHPYCVGSFEGPKPGKGIPGFWIDDFIMLVHHHKNGLDGKVSRVENDRDPHFVTRTFPQPMHQGYRLDVCLLWGQHCGRPAAQAWCQLRGYERAHRFEVDPFIGEHSPTIVLGSGQICDQGYCGGFSTITCSTFGIPLPPSPWE